ncbi:MAG: hypothetical protein ACREN3_15725, partial [Gemmatimonadaceae bacterium]
MPERRRSDATGIGSTPLVINPAELTVGAVVQRTAGDLVRGCVPNAAEAAREIVAALLDVGRHWTMLHATDHADVTLLERADQA